MSSLLAQNVYLKIESIVGTCPHCAIVAFWFSISCVLVAMVVGKEKEKKILG